MFLAIHAYADASLTPGCVAYLVRILVGVKGRPLVGTRRRENVHDARLCGARVTRRLHRLKTSPRCRMSST